MQDSKPNCAPSGSRLRGARAAALATSPLPVTPTLVPDARHLNMATRFGLTLTEQLICGFHVHVRVISGEEGGAVLDRIRVWLPVLLALSANPPFGREPTAATPASATKHGTDGRRRDRANGSDPNASTAVRSSRCCRPVFSSTRAWSTLMRVSPATTRRLRYASRMSAWTPRTPPQSPPSSGHSWNARLSHGGLAPCAPPVRRATAPGGVEGQRVRSGRGAAASATEHALPWPAAGTRSTGPWKSPGSSRPAPAHTDNAQR